MYGRFSQWLTHFIGVSFYILALESNAFQIFFISELIKHGKQTAVIEVAINNCGYSAYNPELYGNTIIVERRICASAQGGYKLKNFQGNSLLKINFFFLSCI